MLLSYDLTTFQILGQNMSDFFVSILVQIMTPKGHFEINWPLTDWLSLKFGIQTHRLKFKLNLTTLGKYVVCTKEISHGFLTKLRTEGSKSVDNLEIRVWIIVVQNVCSLSEENQMQQSDQS